MTLDIRDVMFASDDTPISARLYRTGATARPAIVMAHGFSAVADQLAPQAQRFAEAGFAVLVFDHPGFGRSGGYPRQEVDPPRQMRAFRDAISFIRAQPAIDMASVGVWGSSFSGGHVLQVAASDPRVSAVVAQAPFISGSRWIGERPDAATFLDTMFAERERRAAGFQPSVLPVTSPDPNGACCLPGRDSHAYFASLGQETWVNSVTLSSFEMVFAHEPAQWIARIAPRPLLMIVAENDAITPAAHALDAFSAAREPKKLVTVKGGHFDVYAGEGFEQAVSAAIGFYTEAFARRRAA